MKFTTLRQFTTYFKDENTCLKYLEKLYWSEGRKCPHCSTKKSYVIRGGQWYRCANKECKKTFNVKTGTVFQKSKVPLPDWFEAIFHCSMHKKGISSIQLSTYLDITQKSAWLLMHKIREMLKENDPIVLGGMKSVECDEAYVGGKEKNKHYMKRYKMKEQADQDILGPRGKKVVIGAVERGGKLVLRHIDSANKENLLAFVRDNVDKGSCVYTDEQTAYNDLKKQYHHYHVKHKAHIYVIGHIHTNSIENVWSGLKRCINGTFHHVSEKHIQRYLEEFAGRFNTRTMQIETRLNFLLSKSFGRLTYKQLTK